jgi:methionine-R-sulfoxide reductase
VRVKFESGTGWPSFTRTYEPGRVTVRTDLSYGMIRRALTCSRCEGHLGHVFDDGPPPTGERYCIDSLSLSFVPDPAP